ncbi:MAG TPA: hypothetical protein VE197_17675, partial [Mycobacterium sp.]|nr:hypothetical protein [Mycobacterium sp.]
MNGAGEESVDQGPQPADIDVAVVEVLNSCRDAVMSPTKKLSRITLAATKHIPAVNHAGITVVKHRGII